MPLVQKASGPAERRRPQRQADGVQEAVCKVNDLYKKSCSPLRSTRIARRARSHCTSPAS